MKKILLAITMLFSAQGFAAEYLVKYKNTKAMNQIMTLSSNKAPKFQVMSQHEAGRFFKIDINKKQEAQVLADLVSNPDIEWVVPNYKLHAFSAPIDPAAMKEQWAIAKIQAEKAWQRAGNKGNRNVTVAVIDTGVDYKHKNLSQNMVPGFNFKDNNNDPMDKTGAQNPGHGTHCAGIVGSTGLVDGGVVGMSAEVSMMPLRFLGADGSGSLEDGIKAIDYAIEKNVQVISASWGASVPRKQAMPLIEAVKRADDKGIIFVVAAANDGKNNDKTEVFPANAGWPNTISVAASGPKDAKPSWSNYGTATVHLASPGEGIVSTLPNNKYGDLSGTSMATPLVSGLVAFLKAQDPSLTGAQIRALLQTTGAKVNIETACNCRIDAFAAVDHLLSKKMWITPAAATIGKDQTLNLSVVNGKAPFKYAVSGSSISVDDLGVVKGIADGKGIVTVTDADGKTATTLDINVGKSSGGNNPPGQDPGEDPGTPPGDGGQCPFDPQICDLICQFQPELPFCNAK